MTDQYRPIPGGWSLLASTGWAALAGAILSRPAAQRFHSFDPDLWPRVVIDEFGFLATAYAFAILLVFCTYVTGRLKSDRARRAFRPLHPMGWLLLVLAAPFILARTNDFLAINLTIAGIAYILASIYGRELAGCFVDLE